MRAGPWGIASQFTCALATSGKPTSKIATVLAVQCVTLRAFASGPTTRASLITLIRSSQKKATHRQEMCVSLNPFLLYLIRRISKI